jgi:hypothetical protein
LAQGNAFAAQDNPAGGALMRGVLGHRVDQQPQGKRPSDLLHRSGGFVLVVVAPVVVVVVVVAAAEHSPILCSGSITCDACDASSAAAAPPYASPRRVLLRYTHPSKQPHNLALSIHIHILLLLVNYTAAAALLGMTLSRPESAGVFRRWGGASSTS